MRKRTIPARNERRRRVRLTNNYQRPANDRIHSRSFICRFGVKIFSRLRRKRREKWLGTGRVRTFGVRRRKKHLVARIPNNIVEVADFSHRTEKIAVRKSL